MGIVVPKPYTDELYRAEILTIIQQKIDEHPRSAQQLLGPSGVGGCERKVGWSLAYGSASDAPGGWAAHKGTVLHGWLEETFSEAERHMPDGSQRFFTELALPSSAPDILAGGTCDMYDALYQRTIDWKAPGDWTMGHARSGDLAESYYVQAQVYGAHCLLMGKPVQTVSIMYLPMAGDDLHGKSKGAVYWVWDFDPSVAENRVGNLRRIRNMLDVAPVADVLSILETKSDFCSGCPAFIGSNDRRGTCPGAGATIPAPHSNPFDAWK